MTFLPVAERELRVAARKRSTFWVRVGAAFVAIVIGGIVLVLAMAAPSGMGATTMGRGMFSVLTWISLGAALSAGLFFTSDCLSEEKREGTIGFLFLTDLSGFDVVLGKLAATSLRGFYALLAVLPILAVTLLMGGVTGVQLWRTSAALVNALVVSLAAGLFVSALSRDSQKALAATVLLVLLLTAGGPAADGLIAVANLRGFEPLLSLSSPGYVFLTAGAWGRNPFWHGLLINQALAWTLLGLSCVLIPRTWQEKATKTSGGAGNWARWWRFGGLRYRAALRRKLIGRNPILWLACRERWQAISLWLMTILLAGGFAAAFASEEGSMVWFFAWNFGSPVVTLLIYLGIASQAGRFFVEARRGGLIELMLATPLTARQIVQGQWRALIRMFGPALALCLTTQLLGTFLVQQKMSNRIAAIRAPTTAPLVTSTNLSTTTTNAPAATITMVTVNTSTAAGTVATTAVSFEKANYLVTLILSLATTLTVVANLAALSWFGMWMGMTSRSSNLATLKTIVFVEIIPWFVVAISAIVIIPLLLLPGLFKGSATMPSRFTVWYPILATGLATAMSVAKDVVFILWSRRKLYREFRACAVPTLNPIHRAIPPPLTRSAVAKAVAPT